MITLCKKLIINFFTKGNTRSIKAKKNIFASFAIKGISIAITLILVPLTINYVNPTQYGIWLTLSSIIAWFSFFDIGFGNGLRNRFAEAKATGNLKNARIYISTTYAVLTLIFSLTWILFFILNNLLSWSTILNAPQSMASELTSLALIVISFFCLHIVLKTINTVLIADQYPSISAFSDMLGQVLALFLIIILTKTTEGSLIYLALSFGSSPIMVLLISTIWFYSSRYKKYKPTIKLVDFSFARDIMRLGLKFFVIQIAVIVIYQTSNIIIAQIGEPKDVTIYNIAFKYFAVATMAFSIIITPFWSAFTEAFSVKDYTWMKNMLQKLRRISFIFMLLVVLMTFLAGFVYKLWVGNVVYVRNSISIFMAIYVCTTIWNSLHSLLLNGMGKIKLQLYVSLIGTFLHIPFAVFLGQKFGIEGVITSAIFLNLISAVYSPIQVNKIVNQKAVGVWNE